MKIPSSEDKNDINTPLNNKKRILGNKSIENYLLNIISYILNNKNNFDEKLKFNDLELKFSTDSKISDIDKLEYEIKLNNISFNSRRDINKFLSIYQELSDKFEIKNEIKDEYYITNNYIEAIKFDFMPSFHKNLYLDMSSFPFCYYNINKKRIENYNYKFVNNNNKFSLFLYLSEFTELKSDLIAKIVENINKTDNFFDYFQNIYLIFQVNSKPEIMKIIKDDKLNKFIVDNKNGIDTKIKYIFNIFSNSDDSIYNIFNHKNDYGSDYYFILDQYNKIILVEKELEILVARIIQFISKLKKLMNEGKKSYNDILIEKEKKTKKRFDALEELIYYITKFKKLNYIFDFTFEISFISSIDENCSCFNIKKINYIKIGGELRTKEFLYMKNLLNLLKSRKKNIDDKLKEIPTIDIEINFTDMKCFKCSKIIPEDNYLYYCYYCKTKYCVKCIEEQLQKKGKEKFIDQKHNLLFFKTRNIKHFMTLDKKKLGNNKFAESIDDEQFKNSHSACCNGCEGGFFNMARYVCINCRPGKYLNCGYVDYCQECIKKMCSDENAKKFLEENSNNDIFYNGNNFTAGHILKTRHKHDEHIYLFLPLEFNDVNELPYDNY